MSVKVEPISNDCLRLGESPHWNPKNNTVYFVDAVGSSLCKYTPSTNEYKKIILEKSSSFIIPVEGYEDRFIISSRNDILLISWENSSDKITILGKLASVPAASIKGILTINDAKVDSFGRLWFGTFVSTSLGVFEHGAGGLYSFDENGVKRHLENVTLSNGLTWNEELGKFYFIDSVKGTIDQYDFDVQKGEISNLKEIFTLSKHGIKEMPDGMTIDSDGNLWVALFQGKHVIKVASRTPETLLQKIELPAELVTCPAFGGQNLDELYVTTASIEFKNTKHNAEGDGVTYKITGIDTRGASAAHKFKVANK